MNRTGTERRAGGFTLIEALIAIFILAFGLLAVMTMIDVAFSAGTLSRNTTRATQLAAWMMDRVKQESLNLKQTYTYDASRLRTFDNDATAGIVCDTDANADPVAEPGATACREWRSLIRGVDIPNYLGASQLPGDSPPPGFRGIAAISLYDANYASNHHVQVTITWQTLLTRGVSIESVLATSD